MLLCTNSSRPFQFKCENSRARLSSSVMLRLLSRAISVFLVTAAHTFISWRKQLVIKDVCVSLYQHFLMLNKKLVAPSIWSLSSTRVWFLPSLHQNRPEQPWFDGFQYNDDFNSITVIEGNRKWLSLFVVEIETSGGRGSFQKPAEHKVHRHVFGDIPTSHRAGSVLMQSVADDTGCCSLPARCGGGGGCYYLGPVSSH